MSDFEKLKHLWSNQNCLEIDIKDHIDELKAKDTYMKMMDIPKTENPYRQSFEKECIDLYLLLSVKFSTKNGKKAIEERIKNIIKKIEAKE